MSIQIHIMAQENLYRKLYIAFKGANPDIGGQQQQNKCNKLSSSLKSTCSGDASLLETKTLDLIKNLNIQKSKKKLAISTYFAKVNKTGF